MEQKKNVPSAQVGDSDRVHHGDHQLEEEDEEENHEVEGAVIPAKNEKRNNQPSIHHSHKKMEEFLLSRQYLKAL